MSFKIKTGSSEYRVLEGYSLSKVQRTLQPSAPFKLENRVTLRAGLQYDEAYLCLPVVPSLYPACMNSTPVSIIIGTWETTNWICQGIWKVGCGNSALYFAKFVDSRFFLVEHPIQAVEIAKDVLPSFSNTYKGTTADAQKLLGTDTLEQLLISCLADNVNQSLIGLKGVWKDPWGIGTAYEPDVGRISNISLVDKTNLHLAQYLLDHYEGVFVRDYQAADYLPKLDIVAWTSGSEIPAPYLCSWARPSNAVQTMVRANKIQDASLQYANNEVRYTSAVSTVEPGATNVNGARDQAYEYTDIVPTTLVAQGGFRKEPLYRAMAWHYNREERGYVKPGYEGVRPSGLFDTIVYANEMTTYIRQAVPRPKYHQKTRNMVFQARTKDCGLHPGKVGEVEVYHDYVANFESALCHNLSNHYIPPNVVIPVFRHVAHLGPVGPTDPLMPAWHPFYGQQAQYFTGIASHLIPPTTDPGVAGTLFYSSLPPALNVSTGTNAPSDCYPENPDPEGPGGEEPPPP